MTDQIKVRKAVNKKYISNGVKDKIFDLIDHFFTCNEEPISSIYLVYGEGGQQYLIACPEAAIPHLNKVLKLVVTDIIEVAEFGYDVTVNELIDMSINICDIELDK